MSDSLKIDQVSGRAVAGGVTAAQDAVKLDAETVQKLDGMVAATSPRSPRSTSTTPGSRPASPRSASSAKGPDGSCVPGRRTLRYISAD
jgi:hypothetical protein